MANLIEIATYVENVLRLDIETPVKGYDGEEIGPANEQAQALANRTAYLKKRLGELEEAINAIGEAPYVATVNKQSGDITLTYESLGAAAKEHNHTPSDIKTDDDNQFVSSTEKNTWNKKQEVLVSGETLKTLVGLNLLGAGNITLKGSDIETDDDYSFVSKAEKTKWNSKQDLLVSGENINTLHGKSLLGNNDVTLTYSDVGADASGAAAEAVKDHVAEKDPHTQYITKDDAGSTLVTREEANMPNGYLKLDKSGGIPAEFGDLFKARYIIVGSTEERLAIPVGGDITICLQTDVDTVYYLNAGEDPTVDSNWNKGSTSKPGNVVTVFGRSGIVTPEKGDYTADLITETDDKTFVSDSDRNKWDSKQETLVSGTNVKTINNTSILGSGDIEITPEAIGAADAEHKHNPSDINTDKNNRFVTDEEIETWDGKQDKLVSGKSIVTLNEKVLLASGNIDLTYADVGAAPTSHEHSPSDIETDKDNRFVTDAQISDWSAKQDKLVTGTNIKKVNNEDILGEGNIEITPDEIGAAEKVHKHKPSDIETDDDNQFVTQTQKENWAGKQDKLISGSNLSTVFGKSLLTSKDVTLGDVDNLASYIFETLEAGDETTIELDADKQKIIIGNSVNSDIVDIADGKAGGIYRYPLSTLSFDARINLFKYGVLLPDADVALKYDNPESTVTKYYPSGADSNGDYKGSTSDYTPVMSSTTTGVEKYISGEIPYSSMSDYISIVPTTSLKTVIPDMTNSSTMFTVIGSATYSYMDAKYAFYPPIDEGLITVPNQYFGNNQKWWVRKTDVYLGITSQEAFTILGYGFQNFEEFYWEDCTECSLWEFQARNSDSDSWVVLDRQSGKSMKNYNGSGWTNFMLDKPYTYKQYRMLFLDVFEKPKRPSVVRMAMLNYPGVLVKSAAGDYYNVDELGNFVKITAPSSEVAFKNNCIGKATVPTPVSSIKNLFPIKICSYDSVPVTIKQYKKVPAIALQKPILKRTRYDNLKKISVYSIYTAAEEAELRIAVSPDNSVYYAFTGGAWKSLGQYTANSSSAADIVANGMTITQFNAITEAQWNSFLKLTPGNPISIAYGRNVASTKNHITPEVVNLTFNTIPGWELVPPSKYSVTFNESNLLVTLPEDGHYKVAYLFK